MLIKFLAIIAPIVKISVLHTAPLAANGLRFTKNAVVTGAGYKVPARISLDPRTVVLPGTTTGQSYYDDNALPSPLTAQQRSTAVNQ